ncbi:hypothetical protein FOMPIDRAFT_1033897 [Fomitopsis schrenkii]|uniref:Endonuclease/exonuclease/phosphatase domain-containing protein n=1 Tax=Fomitopsis schrenkii TaxID=2126942 RepID=S8DN85_FOMSC|nr:hypothetical protein FOMPIDRAFT_1033897 [Fomitopsis schrenkii]
MREKRIGLLCIQEAHLSDEHVATIHELYGRRLHILHSAGERVTSAHGIAFVLNREIMDIAGATITEIVPGRAATLRIHWHADKYLTILNVYAPNNQVDNAQFWTNLENSYQQRKFTKPDVVMGDFNTVEAAIDRLPTKEDNEPQVTALKNLLTRLDLHDGWRLSEPSTLDFTFPQRGSMQRSRLDRIYASDQLIQSSAVWQIETTGVPTDHRLVSAQLSAAATPFVGKGRWTLPLHMIDDETFLDEVSTMGKAALESAAAVSDTPARTDTSNPQAVYEDFKRHVVE